MPKKIDYGARVFPLPMDIVYRVTASGLTRKEAIKMKKGAESVQMVKGFKGYSILTPFRKLGYRRRGDR
tara:strand:+ start:419 stop:625 length:207 start_codon:yes stop_codon:yes gene_type:complete